MPGAGSDIDRLIAVLAALRTPGSGCLWDLRQTHESLAPFAIEEAYELADAIHRGAVGDVRDELGDCLLQVVFHARVAEEAGRFAFADVVEAIIAKMLRRHPHVFGPRDFGAMATGATSPRGGSEVSGNGVQPSGWEAIKAEERARSHATRGTGAPDGLLDDVPVALPGLTRAVKLQRRAATVGFDWDDIAHVIAKIREEIDEVEVEIAGGDATALADEIGDLLFAVGNLARHAGVDPEAALRSANAKFTRRFGHIEQTLRGRGIALNDATLGEMEALWLQAKAIERAGKIG